MRWRWCARICLAKLWIRRLDVNTPRMRRKSLPPSGGRESRAQHDPVFGCWLWQGDTNKGLPVAWEAGKRVYVHRQMYELKHGKLAPGKELDHLCRRPLCIAVAHLQPVTRSENEKRKSMRYRARTMRTCAAGHNLELHGAITPEGGKVCRKCSHG